MVSEGAEEDGTVADGRAVLVLRQADRLGDQRLIDVDRAAAPSDLAVVANPPHLLLVAILRLLQCP